MALVGRQIGRLRRFAVSPSRHHHAFRRTSRYGSGALPRVTSAHSYIPTAAVDAQSPLSAAEVRRLLAHRSTFQLTSLSLQLGVLRSQYEAESAKGWVSVQTSFNFAWGSVKSDNKVEVGEGVTLLMGAWRPTEVQ